jgi:N-acetylglutamate synthase/N-acetylornithine aminotransferase
MTASEIKIVIDLGLGDKSWSVFTSDLTEDYVRINKGYS